MDKISFEKIRDFLGILASLCTITGVPVWGIIGFIKSKKKDDVSLDKSELERKIIWLDQRRTDLDGSKQKTVGSDNENIQLTITKGKRIFLYILFIGAIGISVMLVISRGRFWISQDKEIIESDDNVELNEDNVQKNQRIELSKDCQENESVKVNKDNREVIDWEWEYNGNVNDMRLYLKNTPSELGIDVSKYQETIDWKKVKADGIDFAIIRIGSRGYKYGNIRLDSKFNENMIGATANGIKTGVYFYSQAINQEEMEEEVGEILKAIEGYRLDYPVGIELICEGDDYRTYELSTKEHQKEYIDLIKYFCTRIEQNGHIPMIYGPIEWFEQFPTDTFDEYYKWVYSSDSAPNNIENCVVWQYKRDTRGIIDGITHVSVDLSVYNVEND